MARHREVTHHERITGGAAGTQVRAPVRRQDGTPLPAPQPPTGEDVSHVGYWSPLTATIGGVTEIVYANGDTIAVWSPAP